MRWSTNSTSSQKESEATLWRLTTFLHALCSWKTTSTELSRSLRMLFKSKTSNLKKVKLNWMVQTQIWPVWFTTTSSVWLWKGVRDRDSNSSRMIQFQSRCSDIWPRLTQPLEDLSLKKDREQRPHLTLPLLPCEKSQTNCNLSSFINLFYGQYIMIIVCDIINFKNENLIGSWSALFIVFNGRTQQLHSMPLLRLVKSTDDAASFSNQEREEIAPNLATQKACSEFISSSCGHKPSSIDTHFRLWANWGSASAPRWFCEVGITPLQHFCMRDYATGACLLCSVKTAYEYYVALGSVKNVHEAWLFVANYHVINVD